MEQTRHKPVIGLSDNAMPSDIEAALAAGFDQYITKPIDVVELLEVIKRFLGYKLA